MAGSGTRVRRALGPLLALVAAVAACGEAPAGDAAAKADAAWRAYLRAPGDLTFDAFTRANRAAARLHGDPHDAVGVEYQLRALEVQAAESVRIGSADLAESVTSRVAEIESRDLVGVYEECVRGARERLAAAKATAEPIAR